MKFNANDLRDNVVYGNGDGFTTISETITDTSRWDIHKEYIFKYQDKFYILYFMQGATEYQEGDSLEDEDDWECEEVFPVEVTKIEYLTKDQQEQLKRIKNNGSN